MLSTRVDKTALAAGADPVRSPLLRPFFPALDGVRALAFLAVFAFHYVRFISPASLWTWGWVGVDVFFALSGFLITGILYDALGNRHYFKSFYIRRSLRIFPLFYGFWLAALLLTPSLRVAWSRPLLTMAFYLGNFFIPGGLLAHFPRPDLLTITLPFGTHRPVVLLLNQFWSLCVEEQFYLVWPAVVYAVRSRRTLLRLCLCLLVVLPLGRLAFLLFSPHGKAALNAGVFYFNSLTRCDGLLAGAALALWLRGPHPRGLEHRGIATPRFALGMLLAPPAVLALCLTFERSRPLSIYDPVVSTVGFSLVAVAAVGLLLLALQPASRFVSALEWRPLVMLGRLSYGMYFFHNLPFAEILPTLPWLRAHGLLPLLPPVMFAATFAVSWLSFRFYESPFLRLKAVLAPEKAQSGTHHSTCSSPRSRRTQHLAELAGTGAPTSPSLRVALSTPGRSRLVPLRGRSTL